MWTCPLEVVHCEYHNVGCMDKMTHRDQNQYNRLNVEKHLTLTTSELSKAREMITITKKLDTIQNNTEVVKE